MTSEEASATFALTLLSSRVGPSRRRSSMPRTTSNSPAMWLVPGGREFDFGQSPAEGVPGSDPEAEREGEG